MAVSQQISDNGKMVSIAVAGRFDFSYHQQFREAYRDTGGPGVAYRVNLSQTEYMDSSALGMLLLLREYAGGDQAEIVLDNPNSEIRRILETANFHRLFVLE